MNGVAPFETDIFISYAHIDNKPLIEGQKGWVERFHYSLKVRLEQLLGEEVTIWRDKKLQGVDYLDDTILSILPTTAVLISVLSPRYVKSDYCTKELQEFCHAAGQNGGVRVENKSRVVKVIKTPVPRNEHPAAIKSVLGYEFYAIDETTGRHQEFSTDPRNPQSVDFEQRLYDVALDVQQLLELIKQDRTSHVQKNIASPKSMVYLAETTSDLRAARDQIGRELEQYGYKILPAEPLILHEAEIPERVRADLHRCKLSIHPIGAKYGFVPEGEQRSIVQLQLEEAVSQPSSGDGAASRLVWIPKWLEVTDTRQQEFLKELQETPYGDSVEIVEQTLERLKTHVLDRLEAPLESARQVPSTKGEARVYLIYDGCDSEAVTPLKKVLQDEGFEVVWSLLQGAEREVREDHQENLVLCDAVLIYYGQAREFWLRTKLRDVLKAPGWGRANPIVAKAVYVADPAKTEPPKNGALVIQASDHFSPDLLSPFFEEIRKGIRG